MRQQWTPSQHTEIPTRNKRKYTSKTRKIIRGKNISAYWEQIDLLKRQITVLLIKLMHIVKHTI